MNVTSVDKFNIEECIRGNKSRLCEKDIYIFGCTLFGQVIRDALRSNECCLNGFIDNNKEKIGKMCLNVPIYSPEDILMERNPNLLVIICSKYQQEMVAQVISYGYCEKNVLVIDVKESKNHIDDSLIEAEKSIELVRLGARKYNQLVSHNPNLDKVFVCPYPGTGDIYMACIYLPEYTRKNTISNYIMIVPTEGCRKVCELFGITTVQVVIKEDIDQIIKAWEFLGTEIINIKVLLHWGWRCKRFLFSDNHPQVCFSDMFLHDVYDLDEGASRVYPKRYERKDEIVNFFYNNGLLLGRTVILAPYAGSFVSEIPIDFWEDITKHLVVRGFTVCTNCGKEEEKAIKGTIKVRFPYEWAVEFTELAGTFIGLRSGLCDIVSSAKCKLIVLYESGFNASSIDYFGISKMGLNKDALDVEYSKKEITIKKIMNDCID